MSVFRDADTKAFSMLSLTGLSPVSGGYRVRTRVLAAGAWSAWAPVEPGEPLWAGPSTGVELRRSTAGSVLPAGLHLFLADPGTGPAGRPVPASYDTAPYFARQPSIVARADWGATGTPGADAVYGQDVKAVFVHHTAQTNAYECADSPAMVRGLQALHQQTNGWKDIGYNLVVDKCGTVFEGRAGSTDRPVTGAHTLGFNTDTMGIAVIGNYSTEEASPAATAAVARLAAWKLRQYGQRRPAGAVRPGLDCSAWEPALGPAEGRSAALR